MWKLHNHKIVQMLKESVTPDTVWTHVGNNAEMLAWKDMQLQNCAYPLDICPGALLYRQDTKTQRPGILRQYARDD